jgi:tetratricopeptide (TPR) repeat protein
MGDGRTWGWAAALAVITLVTFIGVARCGFLDLDDDVYVTLNPHVWSGLTPENVAWAWRNVEGANWMPLTWMTLQLDGTITGERGATPAVFSQGGPAAGATGPPMHARVYHLQNLMWHIGAVVMLFLLLCRLTGRRAVAGILTLLWAVHPLRVESVAWVAERKDVLAAFWGLLAVNLYVHWTRRRGNRGAWGWYAAVCVAMCLSLMGKAMLVTLPALLLIMDWWPLGRWKKPRDFAALAIEKIPLLALSAMFSVIAIYSQQAVGAVRQQAWGMRLQNVAVSYVRYLVMQVDCRDLGIFYPWEALPWWKVAGAIVLLALTTVACIQLRRRSPWLLTGWAWYGVSLLPVIGLLKVGDQAYADRYTYLPSVGLLMMLYGLVPGQWWERGWVRTTAVSIGGACALALSVVTFGQVGYWQDTTRLIEHTIAVTHGNYYIRYNLSLAYMRNGKMREAEQVLKESVAINPEYTIAHAGLGYLYLQEERFHEAEESLRIAVRQQPENGEYANMLGFALMRENKMGEAEGLLRSEAQRHPWNREAVRNLEIARQWLQEHPAASQGATTR